MKKFQSILQPLNICDPIYNLKKKQKNRLEPRAFKAAKSTGQLPALVHRPSVRGPRRVQQACQPAGRRGGASCTPQTPPRSGNDGSWQIKGQRRRCTECPLMERWRPLGAGEDDETEWRDFKQTTRETIWQKDLIWKHWLMIIPRCFFHSVSCVPLGERGEV